MPRIPSANPDFERIDTPGVETGYLHPMDRRRGPIPMAFQITSPFDKRKLLLPHALVLHVNPGSLQESNAKRVERIQTLGGWVEQHWGDNLGELSAQGSTGAFMNVFTGLSAVLRQRTIAWDRYRDLHDLYHNNGALHDPAGNIVLQGDVLLIYDRGTYLGKFHTFEVEETDDSPFAFNLSWTFKVEHVALKISSNRTLHQSPQPASNTVIPIRSEDAPQTFTERARGVINSIR